MKPTFRCLWVLALLLFAAGCFGPDRSGKVTISEAEMARFLVESELDTPEIRTGSTKSVNDGKVFHKQLQDQRKRWTRIDIWVDAEQESMLHVKTNRTVPCQACKGTGKRQLSMNLGVDFRCPKCTGTGKIESYTEEKKYLLSQAKAWSPATMPEAKASSAPKGVALDPTENAYEDVVLPEENLPSPIKKKIAELVDDDPKTRLVAAEWLDTYYVKVGGFFRDILPMLRKAQHQENNRKTYETLYQFWAGKGYSQDKAYYRIIVDAKTGKIKSKCFVVDNVPAEENKK